MLGDVRDPLLMEPGGGRPKKRLDSEYERKGTYYPLADGFRALKGVGER